MPAVCGRLQPRSVDVTPSKRTPVNGRGSTTSSTLAHGNGLHLLQFSRDPDRIKMETGLLLSSGIKSVSQFGAIMVGACEGEIVMVKIAATVVVGVCLILLVKQGAAVVMSLLKAGMTNIEVMGTDLCEQCGYDRSDSPEGDARNGALVDRIAESGRAVRYEAGRRRPRNTANLKAIRIAQGG